MAPTFNILYILIQGVTVDMIVLNLSIRCIILQHLLFSLWL